MGCVVQRHLVAVFTRIKVRTRDGRSCVGARRLKLELGHRGVLQPRWVQKMHRGGVDFEVEGGCAVEFIIMSPTSDLSTERSFSDWKCSRKSNLI